jgi:putative toxin-antitoxin system antitoxin component (TIGR02293 family)
MNGDAMPKHQPKASKKSSKSLKVSASKPVAARPTSVKRLQISRGVAKQKPISVPKITPLAVYKASHFERIEMIRRGVPATTLNDIVRKMDVSKDSLYVTLRFPASTMDRKIRQNDTLSSEHTERLLGLERLIGQVEVMLIESGHDEKFDASRWVGAWLERPLPALGGSKPADYMDTIEGQEFISRLLAQSQSGAYG